MKPRGPRKIDRARSAYLFELLAVLHLNALRAAGQGAMTPRVEHVLLALQGLADEQWRKFLNFAELQRVRLRTLQLLERWAATGALLPGRVSNISVLRKRDAGIDSAGGLALGDRNALMQTGHAPIVIKTLDHWPDIGSDLDLFTSANDIDTVALWRWTCKLGPNLRVGVTGWRTNGTSTFRAWRNWWRFTWDASGKPASTKPCLLNWNRLHNCVNSGRTGFAFPLPKSRLRSRLCSACTATSTSG